MRSLAAIGIALAALASTALASVERVRTYDARPFGYFVGDTIERSFEIDTGADDKLEPASLPRPGALNYWLEIRSISHTTTKKAGRATHKISLVYQTFYAPIDPRKIAIPDVSLTITTEKGPETVVLPGVKVIASPIREIFPEKSGETAETFLRPDPVPNLISAASAINLLSLSLGAAALIFALIARHLAWWPFNSRAARPFAKAARDITHVLSGSHGGMAAQREAALILHRAFDESAGERLLAADVARFLEARPEHQDSADAIARFFEASRVLFFSSTQSGRPQGEEVLSAALLRDLAARLRSEERGAR